MSFKTMILAAAAVASVALPGAASAQRYGGYESGYNGGSGYNGQPRHGYGDQRFDRHDRRRWEQRRRWEEKQRRREWQRTHRHHFADNYRDYGQRY